MNPSETGDSETPKVVRSPNDYSYVSDGETGNGSHIHDYWDGKDRLTIIERTVGTGTGWGAGDDRRATVVTVRPPARIVVPQGTSQVEVTIRWTDDWQANSYANPELWVKTADDNASRLVQAISSGDTVAIESTNSKNDLPHQQLSGWSFSLRLQPASSWTNEVIFVATVQIEVEAVRGLEIPLFPAHPDQWNGRKEIEIFSWEPNVEWANWVGGGGIGVNSGSFGCNRCPDGWWQRYIPRNGTLVPRNTSHVEVSIRFSQDSVNRLDLAFHGADSWTVEPIEPSSESPQVREYRIPVEDKGDGYYAKQSLWEFWLSWDQEGPVRLYDGSFNITAMAFRDA